MTDQAESGEPAGLLDPRRDPAPVEVVPATRRDDLLLVCEHAGRAIPARLDGLGLSERELAMHIAYDIGAEAVARRMAGRLGCALVVQAFSRLVIDCNRPPLGRQSIPEVSDGVAVPGNRGLSEAEKRARVEEVFEPYARACEAAAAAPGLRAAFSIHSFTPAMGGAPRPWHIGFLHRHPASRGSELADLLRAREPELSVAENAPYRIEDETDWFIPRCAEPRGVPHSLIEIRNDNIREARGQELWAGRLADLIERFLESRPCP